MEWVCCVWDGRYDGLHVVAGDQGVDCLTSKLTEDEESEEVEEDEDSEESAQRRDYFRWKRDGTGEAETMAKWREAELELMNWPRITDYLAARVNCAILGIVIFWQRKQPQRTKIQ